MPVFNAEKYLRKTILSILDQTFVDFECIIIDDGSTDDSLAVIRSFNDERLTVISRENKGLSETLIELVSCASYNYIVRIDADDIAMPSRVELQVNEFINNPRLVLLGTNVEYIDENDKHLGYSLSCGGNKHLNKKLVFGNVFFHPTVMFKKDAYISAGGYSPKYNKYIEDYLLWLNIRKFGDIDILPQVLLRYRIHENSIMSNIPPKLSHVIKRLGLNGGEYPGMYSDYCDLTTSARVVDKVNRKSGYRVPVFFRLLIIKIISIFR
jgi:glycosyltransferase involved in cell wall biosynthesis